MWHFSGVMLRPPPFHCVPFEGWLDSRGGGTWPTNIRGGASGKSEKLPCPGVKFLKMIPCPGVICT